MNIQQMIAIVQSYIHHRKDVEVQINMDQFANPINVLLLNQACNIALNYFKENGGSINFI